MVWWWVWRPSGDYWTNVCFCVVGKDLDRRGRISHSLIKTELCLLPVEGLNLVARIADVPKQGEEFVGVGSDSPSMGAQVQVHASVKECLRASIDAAAALPGRGYGSEFDLLCLSDLSAVIRGSHIHP